MLNFEGIEEDWRRKSVSQMLFKTRLLIVAYLCEKLLRGIFTKCEKLDEDFIPPHHSFDVLSGKFYLWHVAVHARDEIYELAILMWIVGEKYFFAMTIIKFLFRLVLGRIPLRLGWLMKREIILFSMHKIFKRKSITRRITRPKT